MAECGEFGTRIIVQWVCRSTNEYIGNDSQPAQLLHSVLSRFGFLLADRSHHRDQTNMDEADVVSAYSELELPESFDEGSTLDVADSPPQLDDAGIGRTIATIAGDMSDPLNPLLNLIGDVGDDLHGLAEVVTPALALDYRGVHLAGGDVVVPCQSDVEKPLVVTEVQIDFSSVIKHEDLTVFERTHGPGIDVQIGVNLH